MSESWQQNAPRPLAPGMRRMSFEAFWEAVPENVHTLAAAGAAGGDPCDELSGEEDGTGKKEASEGPGCISSSCNKGGDLKSCDSSNSKGGECGSEPSDFELSSQYRGVSYDKMKRKWRVQIRVANLGRSGVSVGYFNTELEAARAYDRAAIGLLGQNAVITNFPATDYPKQEIQQLSGLSREEVKATLKNERTRAPKSTLAGRRRTSCFLGVGSSNRKNQWQARILINRKVTHLGYYGSEEEAAKVYDRVCLSLYGPKACLNFPASNYKDVCFIGPNKVPREELQRSLGVKPMEKSSRFRGVSRKKGKWEAKVMLNRKWAYRELFDKEEEAARAYDKAVWRLKPNEARAYVNFKLFLASRPPTSKLAAQKLKPEQDYMPEGAEPTEVVEESTEDFFSFAGIPKAMRTRSYVGKIQEVSSPCSGTVTPFGLGSPSSPAASPAATPRDMSPVRHSLVRASALDASCNTSTSPLPNRARRSSSHLADSRRASVTSDQHSNVGQLVTSLLVERLRQEAAGRQPQGSPKESRQQASQRPAISLGRDTSLGIDWLTSLANVTQGRTSTGSTCGLTASNSMFEAAAAAAIQEMECSGATETLYQQQQNERQPREQQQHDMDRAERSHAGMASLEVAMTAQDGVFLAPLKRGDSIPSRVVLDLGEGGAASCELELPRPGGGSVISPGDGGFASSPRMMVDRTCHLDFPSDDAMVDVSGSSHYGRGGLEPLRSHLQDDRSFAVGQQTKERSNGQGMDESNAGCLRHSRSFQELLAKSAILSSDLRFPAPKPTITTGIQRHVQLPVQATGKLVSAEDEEILASLEPVMTKLERCNSLVAQEVLITRCMAADAKMLKTTDSPFANPAIQTSFASGSTIAPPRSSSFTSGIGTASNLRQRLARRYKSPLGRGNRGLVSLLSCMGSSKAPMPKLQRVPAPHPSQPVTRGWPVVSGIPLLMKTMSQSSAPGSFDCMAATNNDLVRPARAPVDAESSDEEGSGDDFGNIIGDPLRGHRSMPAIPAERQVSLSTASELLMNQDFGDFMQLRPHSSHDGLYQGT